MTATKCFAGLVRTAHRAGAVEEIIHEDIGLERAAGFAGDDEQRLGEVDRLFDGLDLRRIGAVEHVEARPAGLIAEGFAQHFRPQARPAHAQQHDIGEAALLYLRRKALQPADIGQFPLDDGEPADPFLLVRPGPQRLVAGPEPPYAPFLAPDFHLRVAGGLHFRRALPDLQAGPVALEQDAAALAPRRRGAGRRRPRIAAPRPRPIPW